MAKGLFAAGGLFGPDPRLQRMRIRANAQGTLESDQTKLGISEVTGQQPGAENVSSIGGTIDALGAEIGGMLGKGTPPPSSTPTSTPSPMAIAGGAALVAGLLYFATR